MASKPTALHHQHGRAPNRLVVLKKNGNKTADLGLENGTLIVGGCPIGKQDSEHRSYCIIEEEPGKPLSKADLKKQAAELRAKADAAAAAANAAMQAADAGKDGDKAEELVAAALAADEEAKAAAKAAEEAEAAAK